ncbi:hypothetical protein LIER_25026 [Lithospermum erythrorhizon]|uniref:Uncharacterized protein n=1 Tax=Lithospermum erythrorhizon TaxID=34254 RepID=A0AAV3R794_LITER
MNRIIFKGIKKNLLQSGKCGGSWVEELLTVLWSLRSSPNQATGEVPFSLVYGTEVRNRQFLVGELVLRLFSASHPKEQSKLSPKWEEPYRIRRILGPYASKLCKYYV